MYTRKGSSSWTAQNGTFLEHIDIDLQSLHNITRLETQGRPHSDEYVSEFKLLHSTDGIHWVGASTPDGYEQVFLFLLLLSVNQFHFCPDSLFLSSFVIFDNVIVFLLPAAVI